MLHKKTRLTSLVASALLAGSLSMGCAYNIKKEYPPVTFTSVSVDQAVKNYEEKYGETPESKKIKILQKYFTDEAFNKIASIPVVEGNVKILGGKNMIGLAMGRNFFMNIGQLIMGYGWGKKTIIKQAKSLSDRSIVHEYTHHASALGLIDDCEFEKAWKKLVADPNYFRLVKDIDEIVYECGYGSTIKALFPIIITLEREGELAEEIISSPAIEFPDYIKKVYARTLDFNKINK